MLPCDCISVFHSSLTPVLYLIVREYVYRFHLPLYTGSSLRVRAVSSPSWRSHTMHIRDPDIFLMI